MRKILFKWLIGSVACVLITPFAFMSKASAYPNVNIIAELDTSQEEGRRGVFINKTPHWGQYGSDSIYLPGTGFTKSEEESFYFRYDGDYHEIMVSNIDDGRKYPLKFRVVKLIGEYYWLNKDGDKSAIYNCTINPLVAQTAVYTHLGFDLKDQKDGRCSDTTMTAKLESGYLTGLGYKLISEAPFELPSGKYTGELDYSLGRGGQFDFGDGAYEESGFTLSFNLTVKQTFQVKFPVGSENVRLQPSGGWQHYLAGGNAPRALSAMIPFNLSTGGADFRMYLNCDTSSGNSLKPQCMLAGHPLSVRVSLNKLQPSGPINSAGFVDVYADSGTTFKSRLREAYTPNLPGLLYIGFDDSNGNNMAHLVHEQAGKHSSTRIGIVFDTVLP